MHADMRILPDGLEYEGYFTKCLLSGSYEQLDAVRKRVEPIIAGKLNHFFSGPQYLEFVKTGVSKGEALRETAEKPVYLWGRSLPLGTVKMTCP